MTRDGVISTGPAAGGRIRQGARRNRRLKFTRSFHPLAQQTGRIVHGRVQETEQENAGVQSGHLGERGAERAVEFTGRRVQNWRAARGKTPSPEPPRTFSRLWQKKRLQKQYAAAHRAASKAGTAAQTAEKTVQKTERVALFLRRHWKGALIAGGVGFLLLFFLSALQSCSVLLGVDHLRERGARLPARAPRGAEPARAHGHLAQLPRHGRALRAALDGCARGNAHGDANRTARMRSAIITRAPRRLQTDHRRRGRQGRLWEVAPARLRRGAHDPPRSGRGGRGAPRTWASR